jgi:hypothetical protein
MDETVKGILIISDKIQEYMSFFSDVHPKAKPLQTVVHVTVPTGRCNNTFAVQYYLC